MGAATHKSKKQKKSSHKSDHYGDGIPHGHAHKVVDDFHFNSTLKHSMYSDPQRTESGSNPAFKFPIPPIDIGKANMMNDEVDMYFPKKHFFRKFHANFDLLDNILMKPIPLPRIIPPSLFPAPIIDGTVWPKKKEALLKGINENTEENTEKVPENSLDSRQNKPENNLSNTDITAGKAENKADEKVDEKEQPIKDTDIEKEPNFDEENLSDYDPDFEGYQKPYPKPSDKECRLVDAYINTRIRMKSANDFYFGDLHTMKLQEQTLHREVRKLETAEQPLYNVSERYKYTVDQIEDLDLEFRKYTAESVDKFEKKLIDVETKLATKYEVQYIETTPYRQFKTEQFDSIKSVISLEEYEERKKPKQVVSAEPIREMVSNNFVVSEEPKPEEEKPIPEPSVYDDFDNNMLYGPDFETGEDDDAFGSLSNEMFFD